MPPNGRPRPSTDSVPPTGRGQRQSTSGDRAIGKTPTPIPSVTSNGTPNHVGPIDGSGAKRSPCTHTGINQNPSKTSKSINSLSLCRSSLTSATHPPPSALPPPPTPSTGIPTAERSRDRGSDRPTAFDDCPQHSKSHRQIASIPPKTPSRDAPPPYPHPEAHTSTPPGFGLISEIPPKFSQSIIPARDSTLLQFLLIHQIPLLHLVVLLPHRLMVLVVLVYLQLQVL